MRLELTHKNDLLDLDNKLYVYRGGNAMKRRWQTKTFFFLDRAIYRPGQAVYFKGLAEKEKLMLVPSGNLLWMHPLVLILKAGES